MFSTSGQGIRLGGGGARLVPHDQSADGRVEVGVEVAVFSTGDCGDEHAAELQTSSKRSFWRPMLEVPVHRL